MFLAWWIHSSRSPIKGKLLAETFCYDIDIKHEESETSRLAQSRSDSYFEINDALIQRVAWPFQ